jgi:hypothetical protein
MSALPQKKKKPEPATESSFIKSVSQTRIKKQRISHESRQSRWTVFHTQTRKLVFGGDCYQNLLCCDIKLLQVQE